MIATEFLLISLTAVTVVLANMPYKNSEGEKGMDFQEKSALKTDKQKGSQMNEYMNNALNELKEDYHKNLSGVGISLPSDSGVFQRFRKTTSKTCNILVQKTETQHGRCIRLADNTPACHNDQYLAVNHNDC